MRGEWTNVREVADRSTACPFQPVVLLQVHPALRIGNAG